MAEIIDPVFAKTSPKRPFCMTENERFRLFFVKTGSINSVVLDLAMIKGHSQEFKMQTMTDFPKRW